MKSYISRSKNYYYTKNNDLTNGNIDVGDGSFEVSNDMALSALICTPPQLEEASSCDNILNQRNGNEDNLPIMVSYFDDSTGETSSLPGPVPQSKSLLVSPRQPSLETSKEITLVPTDNKSQTQQRKRFLRKKETNKKDISHFTSFETGNSCIDFLRIIKISKRFKISSIN